MPPKRSEVVKQLIDQPLHVLMTFASVWVLAFPMTFATTSRAAATYAALLTFAWAAYREFQQWPSKRWWDPPLDAVFLWWGLWLGVWSFLKWTN